MLTRKENELLSRVGLGQPMGQLLREQWLPAWRAQSLEAGGAPRRIRLLGENFITFRAADGRVGFFDEGCPHRLTSLALARNEANVLTCIFHGWKIDVSGKVVDVPSEPPERRSEFAAKVRVRHYPVQELGGIIWVYLGKRAQPPRFHNFEFTHLPPEQLYPRRFVVDCNWLQGLEGVLDSSHVGILHSAHLGRMQHTANLAGKNTAPIFEVVAKPYGLREGALRELGDGTTYTSIREVVLPWYSFIPNNPPMPKLMICAIPLDDYSHALWQLWYEPDHAVNWAEADRISGGHSGDLDDACFDLGDRSNLWHQDRQAMKEGHFSGIKRFSYEDYVVQESMGPIVDRTREYLGSSDSIIIRVRRMLLAALRDFQQGNAVFGQDQHLDYSRIRGLGIRHPTTQDWRDIDPMAAPA
jgi:phthalate 4,5-dioxygenase oxygenase subunit